MKSKILFSLIACGGFLLACSQNTKQSSRSNELVTTIRTPNDAGYTVTWYAADNVTPLEVDTDVKSGTMPHYDGPTPTKESTTTGKMFAFFGWSLGEPRTEPIEGNIQIMKNENQEYYPIFYEMTDPSYSAIKLVVDCVDCVVNGKPHFEKTFSAATAVRGYQLHFDLPSGKYVHSLTSNDITCSLGSSASRLYTYNESTRTITFNALVKGTTTFTAVADSSAANLLYTYSEEGNQVQIDFDNPSAIEKIEWGDESSSTTAPFVHEYASTVTTAKIKIHANRESNGATSFSLSNQSGPLAAGNKNISQINYGHTFTTIPSNAFKGCTSLTNLSIGIDVNSIDPTAFEGDFALSTININEYNSNYKSINAKSIVTIADHRLILTTGSIPDKVVSIGSHAFVNPTVLTSIALPSSVTTIEDYAFNGCSNLKTIVMGEGLTDIGDNAFNDCASLSSVDFTKDKNLSTISGSSFSSLPTTPTGIFVFSSDKFSDYRSLFTQAQYDEGYIVPLDDVPIARIDVSNVSIETPFTFDIVNLSEAEVDWGDGSAKETLPAVVSNQEGNYTPNSPTHTYSVAGDYSIRLFTNGNATGFAVPDASSYPLINLVVLHDGFVDITSDSPTYAFNFANCANLILASIPNTVTEIGSSALSGCTQLASFNIPNGVKNIGALAFSKCTALESIKLPSSLEAIDGSIFYQCSHLNILSIDNNPKFTDYGGYNAIFSKDAEELTLLLTCAGSQYPQGLKVIAPYAFYGVTAMPILPNSVTTFMPGAFATTDGSCKIKSISAGNWPLGLTTVKTNTFGSASKSTITTADFGGNIQTIDDEPFGVGATTIAFKSLTFSSQSLTSIGDKIMVNAAYKVTPTVYVYCLVPPTCYATSFSSNPASYLTVHVPKVSLEAYKNYSNWSSYTLVGDL